MRGRILAALRRNAALLWGVALVSGFQSFASPVDADPPLVVLEGRWFVVVGTDISRVGPIRALGNEFGRFAEPFLSPQARAALPIRVEIPQNSPGRKRTPYEVHRGGGQILLVLGWSAALTEETLALGFAESLAGRAQALPGPEEESPVPWQVAGLAAAFLESRRPGFYSASVPKALPPLRRLMDRGPMSADRDHWMSIAFWIWRYGERSLPGRGDFLEWIRGSLESPGGGGVSRVWPDELDWRLFLSEEGESGYSSVQSAMESARVLADLLEITLLVEGEEVEASVVDLWSVRRAGWVRDETGNRLQLVKRWIPLINPLYFNALHSLGTVLEALTSGDERVFQLAVGRLAADLEAADNLLPYLYPDQP